MVGGRFFSWGIVSAAVLFACGGSSTRELDTGESTGGAGAMPSGAGGVAGDVTSGSSGASGTGSRETGGRAGNGTGGDSGGTAGTVSATLVELERHGGLGFCIEPGTLLNGLIESDATSSKFSGTVHLGWEERTSECPSYCEVTEPAGPASLTEAQRDELERLLARLPDEPCELIVSPVCDPCLGMIVTVDGAQHRWDPCASGCDEAMMAVEAITLFFDSLVP